MGQLTDSKIKTTKCDPSKEVRLPDGDNLYLLILKTGTRSWRMSYTRPDGKRDKLSIGEYPHISLKQARQARDEATTLIANGIDPKQHKIKTKQSELLAKDNTFEKVASKWFERLKPSIAISTQRGYSFRFKILFDAIGNKPINEITKQDITTLCYAVEQQGKRETAHRLAKLCFTIFDDAEVEPNPAYRIKLQSVVVKHHPAILDPVKFSQLLRDIDNYKGGYTTNYALKILPHVFTRPIELLTAKWSDIDFINSQWSYVATKTKTQQIVPLSSQVIEWLRELRTINQHSEWVFVSVQDNKKHISNMTINGALRRMGYTGKVVVAHGFRATARTLLDEKLSFNPYWIEAQLNHAVKDANGRAYNRTTYMEHRPKMMQTWSDYLDKLKSDIR